MFCSPYFFMQTQLTQTHNYLMSLCKDVKTDGKTLVPTIYEKYCCKMKTITLLAQREHNFVSCGWIFIHWDVFRERSLERRKYLLSSTSEDKDLEAT